MIRVEMHLFNEFERQIFMEMSGIIEKSRRAQQEALHGNAEPGQRVGEQTPPAAEPPAQEDATVVGHIAPEGAVKYEGKSEVKATLPEPTAEMKYETVEAAMHASIAAHTLPVTRAIIAEYLAEGQRVKDLAPAVWPELVKRLEAGK